MIRRVLLVALLAALGCPAFAQKLIPPERAVDAVRAFCGDPGLVVAAPQLSYDGFRLLAYCYDVNVNRGEVQEDYTVGAEDGAVYSAVFSGPESPGPPTLTAEEALSIAERFARAHYPPFAQRRYQLGPRKYWLPPQHGAYAFQWRQVLNDYGVTAPWWVAVLVDGTTGRVISYGIPPDRVLGPTVPRVTRAQAQRAGAGFTPYDPVVVPFDETYLTMTEDPFGVQRLRWQLCQNQQPPDPENPTPIWEVTVDAITGDVVSATGPLGSPPGSDRRVRRVPSRARYIVRARGARPLECAVPPTLQNEALWIRAEILRGFGVRLEATPRVLSVRCGHRSAGPADLGARYNDYGWWVPLRRTAAKLGWSVDWLPLTKEAVVHSGYVPPVFGR